MCVERERADARGALVAHEMRVARRRKAEARGPSLGPGEVRGGARARRLALRARRRAGPEVLGGQPRGLGQQELARDAFERREPAHDPAAQRGVEPGQRGDGGRPAERRAGAREQGACAGPERFVAESGCMHSRHCTPARNPVGLIAPARARGALRSSACAGRGVG
jgi:hypothetical protein